jgi:hypothetical protein
VLLDLSAAFDVVDYNILFDRLKKEAGVDVSALRWLISYLSDRSQYTAVDVAASKEFV